MGSCCGGNGDTLLKAKAILDQMPAEARAVDTIKAVDSQTVRMEFVGPQVGAITFFGKAREYRGGNNPTERFADIDPQDAARMEGSGQWRRVVVVPATVPVDSERQAAQWEKIEADEELLEEVSVTSDWLMPADESFEELAQEDTKYDSLEHLAEVISKEIISDAVPDIIERQLSGLPKSNPKPRKRGRPRKNRERISV